MGTLKPPAWVINFQPLSQLYQFSCALKISPPSWQIFNTVYFILLTLSIDGLEGLVILFHLQIKYDFFYMAYMLWSDITILKSIPWLPTTFFYPANLHKLLNVWNHLYLHGLNVGDHQPGLLFLYVHLHRAHTGGINPHRQNFVLCHTTKRKNYQKQPKKHKNYQR